MMFYRGPSRFLWFAFGAFAATCYHQTQTRGESRGWGRCGNRRIEEWRAERAAREQWPTNTSYQEKNETTTGKCPRTPAAPPLSEDDVVRRRWEEKAKDAQDTVADLSESALDGILVAAESLKVKLAEFRHSQKREQERRASSEEPEPRRLV